MNKQAILTLCLAVGVLAACADKKDAAAIVNGEKISQAAYEGTLQNLAIPYQTQGSANVLEDPQNRIALGQLALKKLVANEVLAQEAEKQKIKIDEKQIQQNIENLKKLVARQKGGQPITDKNEINKNFKEKLKKDGITLNMLENNIRTELLANALLKNMADEQKIELQEQDIRAFYDNVMILLGDNQKKKEALPKEDLQALIPFAAEVKRLTAERAYVSAVFLATPKDMPVKEIEDKWSLAKDITKKLKNNEISFSQAIAQYSDDKNALKTEGEQLVIQSTLPEELDKSVFTSPLGEVIGPISQPEGIYIIRVNEKRAETKPVYTQLRESIANNLASIQIKQNIQNYVQGLVDKAEVVVLVPELAAPAPEQTKE